MKGRKYFAVIAAVMFLAAAMSAFGAGPSVKTDRVVYLINGALGDNAFYDSGEAGVKNIEKNYKLQTRTIECNFDAAKFQPALDAAVQYADVIFVISYGFEDQLKAIADKYPNKIFVNIDTIVENPKHTITSVFFIAEQSSYLAGMTAALATTTTSLKGINKDKVIGVVGGDTDPIVSAFVFGFQNGAKAVDPGIKVLAKSLGGAWDDSAKGKQAALQLYDQKADVVYQVASAAGIGVLQAAAERGLYAIGVDTNQNDLEPGHVIASAVKNVGATIEEVFKTIKDGTYKAGEVINADLASGGIDLVFDAKQQVLPKSLVDKVNAARQQIIDGKLKVQLYNGENVWQQ
ncbi:putative basic membrane lipoprotein [uncultured spirochete]|jgi:basic membrane protein A|uniref:Putative basic membrane lipoprotein n=1 Tax=uncultured spirochete TaxID=156406 RepID=A0A3P3XPY8_9SPIR|nr:putative basic membrane lipoprotein [uncultured spirochete]